MASIARNYYRTSMDFFHPQIDWRGVGPGFTESEFPVYPYLIALSYKLFGFWDPAGRVISFLFSFAAMILFFRMSRYLYDTPTSMAVSGFFAFSPLLMVISDSIQPESAMFFFYILSAYSFVKWINSQSNKQYLLTFIFTASALLCKITAVNIGFLFAFILIINKGWLYLFKPKVLLLGVLIITPSVAWYIYSHGFYLKYGNSLGISNEYAWVGRDFFTNPYFLKGIILRELVNVWTYAGPFIFVLALVTTKLVRNRNILFPVVWILSAGIFYIIAARTTADAWAYYYHIYSVPGVSMILGISLVEIYNRYSPQLKSWSWPLSTSLNFLKGLGITSLLLILISSYIIFSARYFTINKSDIYKTSDYFSCTDSMSGIIPVGSLILASGGSARDDDNYPLAINAPYFFYWLDRKGFNISVEDQSVEKVLAFKKAGACYYVAESRKMNKMQGFEDELRKKFKVALECNGIVLFDLNAFSELGQDVFSSNTISHK